MNQNQADSGTPSQGRIAIGKSKSTLWRASKRGELSVTKDEAGQIRRRPYRAHAANLPPEIGLIMDVLDLMTDRLAALVEVKEDDGDARQRPPFTKVASKRSCVREADLSGVTIGREA